MTVRDAHPPRAVVRAICMETIISQTQTTRTANHAPLLSGQSMECETCLRVHRNSTVTDDFYSNDNLQDILNTLLAEANILVSDLRRGSSYDELFQVESNVSAEPFLDRFENQLAGWSLNITISFPNNDISIC